MSYRFPEEPAFQGLLRPIRLEGTVYELEYSGEIPAAIAGCFYRCGADPQFVPRTEHDILINGDGQVSMFRFEDGHVDFRIRYVRTPRFERERAARRSLFGAYRNPFTDTPGLEGVDRTTANTSVIWYAGKLLALKEDSLPFEIDPVTLETRGRFDFAGKLRCPTVTAHPETDPDSGEMWFYGYEAAGLASPDTVLFAGDRDGNLLQEDWFVPPYGAMIHDFAITQRHVILPIMPTTADLDRMKAGGGHWAWDGSKPTWIGIRPRNGTSTDFRWFQGPARWSFHTMNGFEQGSQIHLDTTAAVINGFFPDVEGRQPAPEDGDFYLTRWTCDLSREGDSFEERRLYPHPSDFYCVDPRYRTKPYRHGFMVAKLPVDGKPSRGFNALVHIDHQMGTAAEWRVAPGRALQEPVFVPSGEEAEGSGWLMAVVNNIAQNTSDLVILDALRLAAGPVATVHLPLPLRMAFHGEWVDRENLQAAGSWKSE